jgi:hypothetical protein
MYTYMYVQVMHLVLVSDIKKFGFLWFERFKVGGHVTIASVSVHLDR